MHSQLIYDIHSIVVDNLPIAKAAKKIDYSTSSLYSMLRDLKSGKLIFFPTHPRGPKERQTPLAVRQRILIYRNEHLSAADIKLRLEKEGHDCSVRTVERILSGCERSKIKAPYFQAARKNG